jgi:serine/threonine protein kinase/Flp pilus assembly protein TadD
MIGKTISHYKIIEKIGSGGMGDVYKAEDTKLKRIVALKFLPSELTRDEEGRKRFVHEAQAASALDHPNIGAIYEIDEDDGHFFIAMAYYEGKTLKDKIDSNKTGMDIEEAIDLTLQIGRGLAKAHSKNIVHRDIKPANILMSEDGEIKIIDFGLAKLKGQTMLTKTGTTMGTIAYMSPEQTQGGVVDQRSDMWSLGVMFYEMLTGEQPFKGDYEQAVMYSILNEDPEFITKIRGEVPLQIEQILEKILSKNPDKRYQSMDELLAELNIAFEEIKEGRSKKSSIFKLGKKQRKLAYRVSAIILIVIVFGIYLWQTKVAEAAPISVALMPLQSISQDAEQEWFTDGMTEALITDLTKISGLKVISQTTAFKYKGSDKTPPQIAAELGVQYIIEGSILRMGDQIKITARLLSAPEDEYLWAEEYERGFSDILGLQGEIAQTIAGQVQVELAPQEKTHFAASRSIDPQTYELYLKGMFHIKKITPDGFQRGLQYLHEAEERDPDQPIILAGIAKAYGLIAHISNPGPEIYENSRKRALKALELDPNLAEAHLELALTQVYFDRDRVAAGQSYRRALELNPSLHYAYIHYGWFLLLQGRVDEAVVEMKRAIELDPLEPLYLSWLGYMYWWEGEYDKAIEEAQNALELNPNYPVALFVLGNAYADKGMFEEALAANKKAAELNPRRKWALGITYGKAGRKEDALAIAAELEATGSIKSTWRLALIYAAIGDRDKTFYWLNQAYERGANYIQWFIRDGNFDKFQDDPRYLELAQRMNLKI